MRSAPPLAAATLGLALLAPGILPAQDLVTAADPEKILEIARGFGSAELDTADEGQPRITGRLDGTRYTVFFYGCTAGRDCTTIQFWTYLSAPPDAMEAVNAFNRDHRFGKAYIDADGDIAIEMDVNLWAGVTPTNLDDTFDWWRLVLEQVETSFSDSVFQPDAPADRQGITL